MEEFINEVRRFAYGEMERTGIPSRMQADFTTEKGKELARKLGADVGIVEAGTLLMDCMVGQAVNENRQKEHIKMGLDKANEILERSSLSHNQKENIRHCILEHHGVSKFYSLESEICCNADCYKFASIEGFFITFRYTRDMPFKELIKLARDKLNEKWNAISLDIVKRELTSQHEIIMKILKKLPK